VKLVPILIVSFRLERGGQFESGFQFPARGRRARNTSYRAARFNNRMRVEGWLPQSLMHRVETTMTWVNRFQR